MNHPYKYIIFFFILTHELFGQFHSGISLPDKSSPMVVDKSVDRVRYANSIKPDELRKHLSVIASDSLEGRETGQPGIQKAANYITKFLSNIGMSGIPGTKSFLQPVVFTFSKWADTDIFVNGTRFRHLWDYLAFPDKNVSDPVIFSKEVIFLGYGIDDPKYSDYKKVDVKGKIIMINRGEPLKKDSTSYITGSVAKSEWSDADMELKLKTAKEKGVKLVLIIESDIKKMLEENRRKLLGSYLELGNVKERELSGANHCYISTTIAKSIIGSKEEKILKARKKMNGGKPYSVQLPTDMMINLLKETTILEGNNIVAYAEGKSKKDEYIVVSAHYDHLGKRGEEIFNGANDNGSGTVSLMEMAQGVMQASMENNLPERSIVFIWFCGEEKGLLGSEYYSRNPVFPLEQTVADINVDMVGRADEKYKDNSDYIYVIGSDRLSTDLHNINEEVNQKYAQLILDYTYNAEEDPNNYYFRSDHYNFSKNGVPSIFYFNGTHEDYHRPSDDIEKINFDKMARVDQLIFQTMWELASRPDRIKIDKTEK